MSKLPEQERKLRLGHVKPRLTGTEPILTAAGSTGSGGAAAAYTSFDWSYPTNYVTPVRNQGKLRELLGLCRGGGPRVLHADQEYPAGAGNQPLRSRSWSRAAAPGAAAAARSASASNYIRDKGLPLEGCFPYTATNNTCSSACYTYQTNSPTGSRAGPTWRRPR